MAKGGGIFVNGEDIRRFFYFLDPNAKYFNCAFLDGESKNVIKGFGVVYETVDEIIQLADMLCAQEAHPTLHVTLNGCNDKGRKTENVIKTRVLCVDLDVVKTHEEIKEIIDEHKVHYVVKSSPGKFHLYWKTGNIPFETWKKYQLALAQKFGGDLSMDVLPKTIRVPGLTRICKDGSKFIPETVYYKKYDELH